VVVDRACFAVLAVELLGLRGGRFGIPALGVLLDGEVGVARYLDNRGDGL
jgi:hypothetical protein